MSGLGLVMLCIHVECLDIRRDVSIGLFQVWAEAVRRNSTMRCSMYPQDNKHLLQFGSQSCV